LVNFAIAYSFFGYERTDFIDVIAISVEQEKISLARTIEPPL